jgi:hypothetical protein
VSVSPNSVRDSALRRKRFAKIDLRMIVLLDQCARRRLNAASGGDRNRTDRPKSMDPKMMRSNQLASPYNSLLFRDSSRQNGRESRRQQAFGPTNVHLVWPN